MGKCWVNVVEHKPTHILVGGIPTPLKNDGVRHLGWRHSQLNGKSKNSCSKPPTRLIWDYDQYSHFTVDFWPCSHWIYRISGRCFYPTATQVHQTPATWMIPHDTDIMWEGLLGCSLLQLSILGYFARINNESYPHESLQYTPYGRMGFS